MATDFGADPALAKAEPVAHLGPLGFDPGELANALAWIGEQAQGGMAIACGCATTHGDAGGGLEMLNSILSDIAINAELALGHIARIEARQGGDVQQAPREAREPEIAPKPIAQSRKQGDER